MENIRNRKIVLASRPAGMPTLENFRFEEEVVPEIQDGEVLVRTLYLSVDPYMRGRMSDRKSYIPPFVVNQVILGGAIGEVVATKSPAFRIGDIVTGMLGWQLYSVAKAEQLRKVDPRVAPVSTALGILGHTGLTAYFGLLDIGKPQPGETVVVSGAAGAVGTVVCQIAKLKGCKVVGIAGSDEKNKYLKEELGVDATINYRTVTDIRQAIIDACPKGVDIYFDNVGGEISDAVIQQINHGARIPLCGLISQYNLETPESGLKPQPYLLINSALMQGFIIIDYIPRFTEGVVQMAEWLKAGKLKYAEHVVDGFENTPEAFLGLFKGENLGKQLVKVAD
ncbi:MAG: NADPH:quinone reductase [Blastocatellia bacterium]|nr:NADPH:quinone reductase [Blastocatellia bacterium]